MREKKNESKLKLCMLNAIEKNSITMRGQTHTHTHTLKIIMMWLLRVSAINVNKLFTYLSKHIKAE